MAGSIQQILQPIVLTKVVSRQLAAERWILQFMGMEPGGRNESIMGHGRDGSYHVYNNTRKIAKGRAPGTAAAKSVRQGMGRVPFTYPRMHDSVSLLAEEIHNLGRIADPGMRDQAGEDMIRRQTRTLAQKAGNWRAAAVMGMLRDELYIAEDGDDWYYTFTSAGSLSQINFQMPWELGTPARIRVQVIRDGVESQVINVDLKSNAPGIFNALGASIVTNSNYGLITSDSPCQKGEVCIAWLTGLGRTNKEVASGEASPLGAETLAEVKTNNMHTGGYLGKTLVDHGYIHVQSLLETLSHELGIPYLKHDDFPHALLPVEPWRREV